jgi:Uma2 family endonuclease
MLTEVGPRQRATDVDKPYQIIAGEIVRTPSPSPFHQDIILNLAEKLRPYIRSKNLGKLLISPLDIRFNDDEVYQPDLAFVRQSKIQGVRKEKIDTLPDLVIEVLSPSDAYQDLTHKKAIYAKYGVGEYWIIDPIEETIEILVNENGLYRTEALLRQPAELESAMFSGFSMTVEEVFAF